MRSIPNFTPARRPILVQSLLLIIWLFLSACSSLSSPEAKPASSSTAGIGVSVTSNVPEYGAVEDSDDSGSESRELDESTRSQGPDPAQIKRDLVGRSVGQIQIGSIDQILTVEIERAHTVMEAGASVLQYTTSLVVVNPQTQERYQADALLSYVDQNGQWTLRPVMTNNLTRLPEPVPLPPETPVVLGQAARVGAFTVLVHGIQWVDWREQASGEAFSYQQTQRLLVDVSLRNDTQRMMPWPTNATFTIVGSDGTALNAEYGDIQANFDEGAIGLLPPALQTEECTKQVADLLRPASYLKYVLPGEVARRWLSYRHTPGFEQDDLQLEAALPGPIGDEQAYSARFLLHGSPHPAPVPWRTPTAQPLEEGKLGEFLIKDARIGPVGEIQEGLRGSLMQCTFQRIVTMQVQNTSAETQTLTTNIWLLDGEGRVYEPLPLNNPYQLAPRETQAISLAFPALVGVQKHPIAVLLGESSLNTVLSQSVPTPRLLVRLTEQK